MASTRVLSKLISGAGGLSAGAVLSWSRAPARSGAGRDLAAVGGLLRLLAETLCLPAHTSEHELRQIEDFLKALVVRYGVARRAVEAISSGKRRHTLISGDRARAWGQVLSAVPAVAEQTLSRQSALSVAVSRWVSNQPESLESSLDALGVWMDGALGDESALLSGAAVGTGIVATFENAAPIDPKVMADLELVRERVLRDKRPMESIAPPAHAPEVAGAIGRLRESDHPLGRAVALIAAGEPEEAERELADAEGAVGAEILHELRGDRLYTAKLYDDAVPFYRLARSERDSLAVRRSLAMALIRSTRGSQEAHTKEAIDLLTDGLRGVPSASPDWVRTKSLLGLVWVHTPTGDRDANVRHAIECFEEAIAAVDRAAEPEAWAELHLHLGSSWQSLPSGKLVENIQRAITCFNRALEVWTREMHPEPWAAVQNNLGHAWERLPTGIHAVNMERAIEYFNAALSVRTREASPTSWAQLQNNLGNAWIQFPIGDKRENILRGIACHTAALDVWSQAQRRHEWAATQNNLGNAYALLPDEPEERARNLRRAIAAYKAALEMRTRSATPIEWASTQNNLGNALLALAGGHDNRLVDEAVECFRKALDVRTRQAFPVEWAKTKSNLGHAYSLIKDEERRENLEEAAQCYAAALEVLTPEAFPHNHEHIAARLAEVKQEMRQMGV